MADDSCKRYTILALGFAKWWGSDARALAHAFKHLGHNVLDSDEEDFISWKWEGIAPRVIRRLTKGFLIKDYNEIVLRRAHSSHYDFILVYKGRQLKSQTLDNLRALGKSIYNFYPDVSFTDHGDHIPSALPKYDCIFTTKSYHGEREQQQFKIKELRHVRHGFDPDVHRPVQLTQQLAQHYGSDVSFVGCWSPEKEETIQYIAERLKDKKIKVFGIGWKRASSEFKKKLGSNLLPGIFGDELALVYRASKVNLGLLSRAGSDVTLKDETTARTFQIPATNSFMLHEDTPEVRTFFHAGEEVMLFKDKMELMERLEMALNDDNLRLRIAENGYRRCWREPYDYSAAAQNIVSYFGSAQGAFSE